MHDTHSYTDGCLLAGASGYVLKDVAGDGLAIAVRSLYDGNTYFSKRISEIAKHSLGRCQVDRTMIKVLVAEDHPIMRDVLRRLFEQAGDIEIVAMERTGEKAVNKTIVLHPDVAILDVKMPTMDGIEATKEILAQSPETRVLILSGFNTPEYIEKSLKAGAWGYVLKDFTKVDLISGVRSVYEGRRYFSLQIVEIAKRYITDGGF